MFEVKNLFTQKLLSNTAMDALTVSPNGLYLWVSWSSVYSLVRIYFWKHSISSVSNLPKGLTKYVTLQCLHVMFAPTSQYHVILATVMVITTSVKPFIVVWSIISWTKHLLDMSKEWNIWSCTTPHSILGWVSMATMVNVPPSTWAKLTWYNMNMVFCLSHINPWPVWF